MNEFKFPNSTQVLEAINNLKNIKWPEFDNQTPISDFVRKFEELYFKELHIFPSVIKIKKTNEFPLSLFRVREFNPILNKDLISEYSYPPINLTKIGRCNFPKRPVFYCSDNPMVALMETVRNNDYTGKVFCISKWNFIPSENEFVLEHFLRSGLHPDNPFNILVDTELNQLKEQFKKDWDKDVEKGFLLLQEFLHETFINDKDYGLSATLAHRTMFAPHNMSTDILLYPSVQTKYKGTNMAINPNFVDQQMQLQRLYLVKLNQPNMESGEFNISFTQSYGVMSKNKIEWKQIGPNNEEYKKLILEDFASQLPANMKFVFEKQKSNHNTK